MCGAAHTVGEMLLLAGMLEFEGLMTSAAPRCDIVIAAQMICRGKIFIVRQLVVVFGALWFSKLF